MSGPLSGIRVVDLSRVLAGPWCTQTLADLGAEVIKIERPGSGDETRQWGPPWFKTDDGETGEAAYYMAANRGKYSLTLDISTPDGQQIVRDLCSVSDVLVENFKTGGLAKKGLAYDDIKQIKNDIIYCSITGFGQTGPKVNDAGYDYLIQGMGGLMSITGIADGEPGAGPIKAGVAVADLTTGMYATIAITSALFHRQATGAGQHIDMALLDTQVGWLANQGMNYFVGGNVPKRSGAQHPNLAPYQPFKTSDSYIILAIGNDGQFQRFCREVGQPELADDERFNTNPQRNVNRKALIEILSEIMLTRTSKQWMDDLKRVSVACGPINDIAEVFNDEQVQARGMKIELTHANGKKAPGIANPIKFSESEIKYAKAPPMLGEDTEHVLTKILGKNAEEINTLKEKNVL